MLLQSQHLAGVRITRDNVLPSELSYRVWGCAKLKEKRKAKKLRRTTKNVDIKFVCLRCGRRVVPELGYLHTWELKHDDHPIQGNQVYAKFEEHECFQWVMDK